MIEDGLPPSPTNTVISSGYTDRHHWRAYALCRSVTKAIEGYRWGRLVEIRSQHSEVQVKKQSWPWMSKDTAAWAHPWKKWAHVLAIKAVDQRIRILVFAASWSKWSFAWNHLSCSLIRYFLHDKHNWVFLAIFCTIISGFSVTMAKLCDICAYAGLSNPRLWCLRCRGICSICEYEPVKMAFKFTFTHVTK